MKKCNKPAAFVLAFYLLCFVFRLFEYFILRTDHTLSFVAVLWLYRHRQRRLFAK